MFAGIMDTPSVSYPGVPVVHLKINSLWDLIKKTKSGLTIYGTDKITFLVKNAMYHGSLWSNAVESGYPEITHESSRVAADHPIIVQETELDAICQYVALILGEYGGSPYGVGPERKCYFGLALEVPVLLQGDIASGKIEISSQHIVNDLTIVLKKSEGEEQERMLTGMQDITSIAVWGKKSATIKIENSGGPPSHLDEPAAQKYWETLKALGIHLPAQRMELNYVANTLPENLPTGRENMLLGEAQLPVQGVQYDLVPAGGLLKTKLLIHPPIVEAKMSKLNKALSWRGFPGVFPSHSGVQKADNDRIYRRATGRPTNATDEDLDPYVPVEGA